MGTEWMSLTRFEPRSWLLANGEIVTEPALEQTSTGRKVRVVGTKNSYFASNLDQLLWDAANLLAQEKNTRVVMEVVSPERLQSLNPLTFDPHARPAKAHMVHSPGEPGAESAPWWRFKHPTLPIEATVGLRLRNYPITVQPTRQYLAVELAFPAMRLRDQNPTLFIAKATDNGYTEFINQLPDAQAYSWREFLRDNRPNWPDVELIGGEYILHMHRAVERVHQLIRTFENLDTLQIPDITNLDQPGWLDLELYETNVNAEFVSDFTEWLDSNPAIDGVLNAYQNLLDQMRIAGFIVETKRDNDFMAALLNGDKPSMHMEVKNVINAHTHGVDQDHTVSIHLPTGSFVVECTHNAIDHGEVAERWEETLTIAKMTGQEDVLLEFARQAARDKVRESSQNLIKSRQ